MGWVNAREALNRRNVRVCNRCDHHTVRCERHKSPGVVVVPKSERDRANRIERSSHGLDSQISNAGNHDAIWNVAAHNKNSGKATER